MPRAAMHVNMVTIQELFNSNVRLEIPEFQRQYQWTEQHCLDLLRDACYAYEDSGEHCYSAIFLAQQDGVHDTRQVSLRHISLCVAPV